MWFKAQSTLIDSFKACVARRITTAVHKILACLFVCHCYCKDDKHRHSITALDWLRSFLTRRVQVAYFAGDQSSRLALTSCIPQGSVSDLLLFSLNIADVVRITYPFGVRVHCCAGDLQPYVNC